jgi:hypothetical protein
MAVVERPEAITIVAGRFRLCFLWTGDRWTHRLESADGSIVLASAFETPAESAPVSPTYQDLHIDSSPDHATAMALGRFGHHHYSATFRVAEHPHPRIEVDVADRGPADSPLTATYTVHRPPGDLAIAPENRGVLWGLDHTAILSLGPHPDDPSARVSAAEAGRAACRLQVQAAPGPTDERTRRLRYSWIIHESSPDLESCRS